MSRFVDLSHPITSGEGAYRGFDQPIVEPYLTRDQTAGSYDGKTSFEITRVTMVGNTGTSIDAPYHRFDHEDDLAMMPLEILAGLPIIVIDHDPTTGRAISVDAPTLDADRIRGYAVLFRTGWDARWLRDEYWDPGPYLSQPTIDALVGAATLVGVDFANIDDLTTSSRPAHTQLLSAGIPIVEHLCNLSSLPAQGGRLFAAPLAINKGASFPVRAFAELDIPDPSVPRPSVAEAIVAESSDEIASR